MFRCIINSTVYPLLPVSILVFWDSRADRMRTPANTGERKCLFLCFPLVHLLLLFLISLSYPDICPFKERCAVSWGQTRSRRAQGQGHHQGAAAVLISPNPATTFSSHTWGKEESTRRVPWVRKSRRLVSWKERRHTQKDRKRSRKGRVIWSVLQRSLHHTAAPLGRASMLPPSRDNSGLHVHW